MSALIVISCSERKRFCPKAPIPAIERYDGVFYRLLRKARRENRFATTVKVVILSAKYGLIMPHTLIPHYEFRMTKDRALLLRASVQRKLKRMLRRYKCQRVYINLGAAYAPLILGISAIDNGMWATGGIGTRAQKLKAWLDAETSIEAKIGKLCGR